LRKRAPALGIDVDDPPALAIAGLEQQLVETT
jgi:hypothetical protein